MPTDGYRPHTTLSGQSVNRDAKGSFRGTTAMSYCESVGKFLTIDGPHHAAHLRGTHSQ
ncbi:hypothetical protein [Paraburkholderia sp. EG304]|uniref:hypothetical protein n=1 Tax=Paraburkholderia sp. EG304 TaxID=3237015 RepID=UPI00397CBC86